MADTAPSRKPQDSAIKQQRLKAWQPILTPKWVIGTFLVIGIIFVPLGVELKAASDAVVEVRYAYDGKNGEGGDCGITTKVVRPAGARGRSALLLSCVERSCV